MFGEKKDHCGNTLSDASWIGIGVILTVILGAAAYYVLGTPAVRETPRPPVAVVQPERPSPQAPADLDFEQSANEDEFRSWLSSSPEPGSSYGGFGMVARGMALNSMVDFMEPSAAPMAPTKEMSGLGVGSSVAAEADRYSSTNVQVAGIDEPDRVKTDGERLYYAPEQRYYYRGIEPMIMTEESVSGRPSIMPPQPPADTGVAEVKAFPLDDLAVLSRLEHTGEMLLSGDTLMVFDYDGVYGYDVSDPGNPQSAWQYAYSDGNSLEAARLFNGRLYLITRSYLNRSLPCPITPLTSKAGDVRIGCGDIWHRAEPSEVDTTFAVATVDPATGDVEASTAFVGPGNATTVAMFPGSIYVASELPVDSLAFMVGFLNANADLTPADVLARLNRVVGYDLSLAAKQAELAAVMDRWLGGLGDDERLRISNELANRITGYWRDHAREVGGTAVVKVDASNLKVTAVGRVPGTLLNQFSLDEYGGNLRVAVTVGGRNNPLAWQFGIGTDDSVSDVYVLDGSLKVLGSAQGMGEGERIYSVRFMGDRGYVVTFRETDPFYVLDLSDARNPSVKGELKIPGYSSYLHPLGDDTILGIGKEGSQVKLSVFDVTDPAMPVEKSKYSLDEYWSDVLGTHHAFLQDEKHSAFFMPGSKGGYVFSYGGDSLNIERAVAGVRVTRAVYINDYLYLVGEDQIVVLDEKDWNRVAELKF